MVDNKKPGPPDIAGAKVTPVAPSLIDRLSGAVRAFMKPQSATQLDIVPANDFFGPLQPMTPEAPPDAAGRGFDYRQGFNQQIQPRDLRSVGFHQLRFLADNLDLVRLAVESRKDQMGKLTWSVIPVDPDQKIDGFKSQIAAVESFLRFPDRNHDWSTWLRMLIEDMLVVDAATIYPRRTKGGDLYSLDVIDGTTIVPKIDVWGRIPEPDQPAYQQVIKGISAINYTSEEILYRPRNLRSFDVYGYSPVEQIVQITNIGIRRQIFQLNYYTEGTVPDALVEMPDGTTTQQIEEFQKYFDGLLSGNLAERRKIRFLPSGMTYTPTKDTILTDKYDEWLARIIMYAFSLPPTAFTQQTNRATSETLQEQAEEEGLAPLMIWTKNTMDLIIQRYMNQPDLQFSWKEDVELSPLDQSQIDNVLVRAGIKTVNESRADSGLDPVDGGDINLIFTASGAVPLSDPTPAPPVMPGQVGPDGKPLPPKPGAPKPGAPKPGDESAKPGTTKLQEAGSLNKLQRINRTRKALDRPQRQLETLAEGTLRSVATDVARQLPRLITMGRKRMSADDLRKASDEAEAIMAKLNLGGFAALVKPTKELLDEIFQLGGQAALDQLGIEDADSKIIDVVNQEAIDYARSRSAELVTGITETTRDSMRSVIEGAMTDNMSTDELKSAIMDDFAFSASRAQMIARTEIAKADVQGNLATYRESGVVSGKQWILGSEHDIDDECSDNVDDGIIGLDDTFSSGDDGPPAHPNCVCDIIPVTDETDSEG